MKSTNPKTHIVQAGETLFVIAQKYEITLEALIAANPDINPELIVVGQTLNIPDPNNGGDSPSSDIHIVQQGETLSIIAQKYGLTLDDLLAANPGINPDLITIGQEIKIPDKPELPPLESGDDSFNPYSKKVIGYFENWGQWRKEKGKYTPKDINPNLFTHINYAFALFGFQTKPFGGPKLTGNYKITPIEHNDVDLYRELQGLKSRNPKLKTLISIGGWSFNDPTDDDEESPIGVHTKKLFSEMASSNAGRREFITSVIDYAKKHGFDGIDLDWEYPGDPSQGGETSDFENFLKLIQELRQEIDKSEKRLLLTIAAAAIPKPSVGEYWQTEADFFSWLAQCVEYLDWVNIMSYDYHGAFDHRQPTGVNAPLYEDSTPGGRSCVDITLTNYLTAGIPEHKIVLGLATYGRTYMLKNPPSRLVGPGHEFTDAGDAGELTGQPGVLSYIEIADGIAAGNFERGWDDKTSTPYAYDKNSGLWASYDDQDSLKIKAEYAGKYSLSGIMFWAIGLDDFNNGYPLISEARSSYFLTVTDFDELRRKKEIDVLENSGFSKEDQEIEKAESSWIDINDAGMVIQVFVKLGEDTSTIEDSAPDHAPGSVMIRLGIHTDEGILWKPSQELVSSQDQPAFPKVALNNQGYFVVVMENSASDSVHYALGKIEKNNLQITQNYYRYSEGRRPSVTLTDDNQVIEIHQAALTVVRQGLWSTVGQIQGNEIKWKPSVDMGQSGREPDIAVLENGNAKLVLEVHRGSGDSSNLWYRTGQLSGQNVDWSANSHNYDSGEDPSVGINNNGDFVIVHKTAISDVLPFEYDNLWYRSGNLSSSGNVSWFQNGAIQYNIGENPSIGLARNGSTYRLVETHLADISQSSTPLIVTYTSIPLVHELIDNLDFSKAIGIDLQSHGTEVDEDGEIKRVPLEIPKSFAEQNLESFLFVLEFVPVIGDITAIVRNSIECNKNPGSSACVEVGIDAAFLAMDVIPGVGSAIKAVKGTGKALATGVKGIKDSVKKYNPDEVADAYKTMKKDRKGKPASLEPMWKLYEKRKKTKAGGLSGIKIECP